MRSLRPSLLVPVAIFLALACPPNVSRAAPYLGRNAPVAIELLPPPPAADSEAQKTDLEQAARVYAERTPEQVAFGRTQLELTIFCFEPVIGDFFYPHRFPRTEAMFTQVNREISQVAGPAKKHWNRLRPYLADPARFPDTPVRDASASYPSGHATRGVVYARLLAELFPAKRKALLEFGDAAGWVRVQIGVHYPTDVDAGRILGNALAAAFLQSPEFQKDLAAAKAEIASGGRSWLVRNESQP